MYECQCEPLYVALGWTATVDDDKLLIPTELFLFVCLRVDVKTNGVSVTHISCKLYVS